MAGEIHPATIVLTAASAAKARLVLLLKQNCFGGWLYLPLTGNLLAKGITIDNSGLQDGYLPKASVMAFEKTGVMATSR